MSVAAAFAMWCVVLVAGAFVPGRGAADAAPSELVLRRVHVVDPSTGRVAPDRAVVVRGGRILRVVADRSVGRRPGAVEIDGGGRWLVPGLWDMHVHALWDTVALRTFVPALLVHGITGFRDMGGRLEVLERARREAREGRVPWPRVVAAGPWLDGPVPVDPMVGLGIGSADAARRAVDSLAAAGVDFIKVYTPLDREPFLAVLAAARRHRLPVAGHVPHEVTTLEAAAWGMRSIEHLRAETGGLCAGLGESACDSLLRACRRHGVWQVPTLIARRARARAADTTLGSGPGFDLVPASLRAAWERDRRAKLAKRPASYFEGLAGEHRAELALAARAWLAGVPMLGGSDCGSDFTPPGASLHDELDLLVGAGMRPADALRAVTSDAARFLGRERSSGRVAAGYDADLVLLESDPLEDIGAVRRIAGVVMGGRWLGVERLAEIRREAAEFAASH